MVRSAVLIAAIAATASAAADLIVVNAVVRTMKPGGAAAEAFAVTGDKITAVGGSREIRRLAGPQTRVVDAGGRLVLPGFNDAHVHFLQGGFQLSSVDLRDAATREEFTRRIGEFVKNRAGRRWVTGGDWDHELWPGAPLPTKEWIDEVSGSTPVFVSRLDGHMALANSEALRRAGIGRETKDPPGGVIVRNGNGDPAGVLKDAAMGLVYRVMPQASREEKLAAARAATKHAARLGVTSVQDVSAGGDVSVYQELDERGELLTRIYAVWPLPDWERLAATGVRRAFGPAMLRIGGLKGFADGSLGSTTALFHDDYSDAPGQRGLPSDEMTPPERMAARIAGADKAGLQLLIHAIGDRANAEVLDMFETAAKANGARDRRFRIEHAQHLSPAEVARFKQLGVVASMQPYHAADDGRWADKRIGKDRARGTYAFRWLLDAGVRLAFGSDWTVAPLDPLLGIEAAVTRRTIDGKHPQGWVPEQKIGVEEAVRAYTHGSAYAEYQETAKGTIEVGKLADFVMLDRDIFTVAPETISRSRVILTAVGGKIVHEAGGR